MSIGLVFSGGGTCGAYQIGFWKALKETGADKEVTALSGSSVGSLNALLFANGDLELATDIWLDLKQADMFRARAFLDRKGIFSQIGYSRFIDRLADNWETIRKGMPIYSCVSVLENEDGSKAKVDLKHFRAGRPEYILLNALEYPKMKNAVLASSAVPYVYPHRHVKGRECVDGDFSDKTPYLPIAGCGCDFIIILHLNSREEAKHRPLESGEAEVPGYGIKLYHLYPDKSLGLFLAVSDHLNRERYARGYADGMKFLKEQIIKLL